MSIREIHQELETCSGSVALNPHILSNSRLIWVQYAHITQPTSCHGPLPCATALWLPTSSVSEVEKEVTEPSAHALVRGVTESGQELAWFAPEDAARMNKTADRHRRAGQPARQSRAEVWLSTIICPCVGLQSWLRCLWVPFP
ncbi:hypothetical protein CgunFtcFv8_003318 [Champsocephalus gunnari]|uniref:Uncharacterized protein n=1 Tax=Champsocephalus gunnari TaxID=52237 RepID=A0AAN8D856_CHAGU|nr:hypothetical protein CgunFtcFv8_003318 [Champsocephalus gunnari]